METTFEVKWRPFGDYFEDDWRPIIKLSIVLSIFDCNNFGFRKMALIFLYFAFISPIFYLSEVHKKQNDNLAKIKKYSMIAC